FVLRETLKLLHPVMPFITEELWDKLGYREEHGFLIGQRWPTPPVIDKAADDELNWLVKLISEIRSTRSELNVPAAAKLPMHVIGGNEITRKRVEANTAAIGLLSRVEGIDTLATAPPTVSAQIVLGEAIFALPLAGVINPEAESARLQKEIR